MGNAQRSVKTLSGGETFLLSLALSLSLSDIASRNNVIECLYIDEGFGTLDQETLEMAINTLENLQYQTRKSIGIISHVQSLKERIGTRIEISKNERGFSSFSVVSN
jgi:exonuclease SbcC